MGQTDMQWNSMLKVRVRRQKHLLLLILRLRKFYFKIRSPCFSEPVSMASVIGVVIALLVLFVILVIVLLYAYKKQKLCFKGEFWVPFWIYFCNRKTSDLYECGLQCWFFICLTTFYLLQRCQA